VRLNPTPPSRLCDSRGRPYYLWDSDTTLEQLESRLSGAPRAVRAYWLGKVMRQARPDDVLVLVTPEEIVAAWPDVRRHLGRTRSFWTWLLRKWGHHLDGQPT
jgi:hypothetical protein